MAENSNSQSQTTQQMSELFLAIAKSLVDSPDKLRIETVAGDPETVLRLVVAESDLGKLIGKNGRTARSLRTIMAAAGNKANRRYALDIRSLPPSVD